MAERVGPDAVIRPALTIENWPERLQPLLPYEARCRLCEAPPLVPGETEVDYTERLKTEGIAFGPATKNSCEAWVEKHLRQKHRIDSIGLRYEVKSGQEQWVV